MMDRGFWDQTTSLRLKCKDRVVQTGSADYVQTEKTLQQMWRNQDTGDIEWRNVPEIHDDQ